MSGTITDLLNSLIIGQYRDDPVFIAIIASVGKELDLVTQALIEEATISDISSCSGILLDLWGALCGEPRGSKTDAEYITILNLIYKNPLSGTPDEIMREMSVRYSLSSILYIPEYPANFFLIGSGGTEELTSEVINEVAPAGVGSFLGVWLALEDDDPYPYPAYLKLEDEDAYLLLVGGDYGPPPAPEIIITPGVSPVAHASVNISAGQLVGLDVAGNAILADASIFVEAIGVAQSSAAIGESLTILQSGPSPIISGVSWTGGQDLYLGLTGNWATTPPISAHLTQRVGMASITNIAAINIQQGVVI